MAVPRAGEPLPAELAQESLADLEAGAVNLKRHIEHGAELAGAFSQESGGEA